MWIPHPPFGMRIISAIAQHVLPDFGNSKPRELTKETSAIIPKARKQLNDLLDRAKRGGWEIPDSIV
jgi:hypothetical protein